MKYSDNPNIKERLNAFETGERHFRGAGDAFNEIIEGHRADNGHALVNLRAIERAEQAGLNFTEKAAAGGGTARERESNGELEKWKKIVADGKVALKDSQKKQSEQYGFGGNYGHSRKLIVSYLLKLTPGSELLFSNRGAVKRKQESDPEALVRIEAEISDALDLRKKTLRAPKSLDEKKECWTEQVRQLAKTGEPDWLGLHAARGKEARLPSFFVDSVARPNGLAFAMWAFEDALIAKGHEAIEEFSALEGSDGLTAKEREAKLADLDSVIFEKESEYETLWLSLARNGLFVPRRKIFTNDARPLAGLSSDMVRIEIKNV